MDDPLAPLRPHFTGLGLREEGPHGRVYTGHDPAGIEVTVAVLTGGSATDPGTRNAFADVVWRHSVGSQPGRATVLAADLHASHPWAATRAVPGEPGAEQLLAGLAGVPVPPAGPSGLAAAPVPAAPPPAPPPAGYSPAGYSPAGHPPLPPARRERAGLWLVGVIGAALALALVAVVAGLAVRAGRGADDPAAPAARTAGTEVTVSPGAAPTPGPSPTPGPGPTGGGGDERPSLREVEPVSVVGPTFGSGDDTYTMAFPGWPVAFRAPGSWGCLRGELDPIPDADVWTCIDEGDPENGQRANLLLWECATTCTETEQADMIDRWLDEPERAVQRRSSPTSYVETETSDFYSVDLGHFFGPEPGGPLRWLVGVYVESPFETRAAVQKLLNDVVSQAGGAGG